MYALKEKGLLLKEKNVTAVSHAFTLTVAPFTPCRQRRHVYSFLADISVMVLDV